MNKKIAIVHRSEIIRKGLVAICRSFYQRDAFQFADIQELKEYTDIQESINGLFIETANKPDPNFLLHLQNKKGIKIIGIQPAGKSPKMDFRFDAEITTLASSSEIRDIFTTVIELPDNKVIEHEDEELTLREKDVLKLVALGHSNKEMADKLFISIHTVISHRKNITEKLGIKSISGLTVYAILNKLIDTENLNPDNLI
jgi:DNA-binding CsgD family transcriptional regulator